MNDRGDARTTRGRPAQGGPVQGGPVQGRAGIAKAIAEHASGHEFPRDLRPTTLRLRKLTQRDVDDMSQRHRLFARGRTGGARASFAGCDLGYLDFKGRALSGADFSGAGMSTADIREAVLSAATQFARILRPRRKRDERGTSGLLVVVDGG